MANNFSDVSEFFSGSGFNSNNSVIRRMQNKIVHPFSDYSESDSSDDDKDDIQNLGGSLGSNQKNLLSYDLLLKTQG